MAGRGCTQMADWLVCLVLGFGGGQVAALGVLWARTAGGECGERAGVLSQLALGKFGAFFLYTKGVLFRRASEQKFAFVVVAYEVIALGYLGTSRQLDWRTGAWLAGLDAGLLLGVYLSIGHTGRRLNWRREKRLVSGKTELFFFQIRTGGGNLLFVLQYFMVSYLLSPGSAWLKPGVAALFGLIYLRASQAVILRGCWAVAAGAFAELLFAPTPTVPGISVFVFSAAAGIFLGVDGYFGWQQPQGIPRRAPLG